MNWTEALMRRIPVTAVAFLALAFTACSSAPQIGESITSVRTANPAPPYVGAADGRAPASAPSSEAGAGAAVKPAAPSQNGGAAAVSLPPLDRMIIRSVT